MFKPLNNRLLVRSDEPEQVTAAGILLVTDKDERAVSGTVLIGSDSIAVGERILFSAYGWDEATIDGEKLYLVATSSVLGIF